MAAKGGFVGDEEGKGFLVTIGGWVYWLVVIELLLLLTCLPTLLAFLMTGWSGSGVLVAGLSLVFVGPALAAALFAWRKKLTDPDMSPAKHFFRGYKVAVKDMVIWWVPWTVVVTAILMAWLNQNLYDGPRWMLGFSLVVLIILALVGCHMVSLSALFSFRLRDRVRLAISSSIMHPIVTVGYAALLFLAGVLVWLVGDIVPVLLASLSSLFAYLNGRPVEKDVTTRFIRPADDAEASK